ncbi:MAG TPA: hypothetical protein VG013_14420 [Gemmataceae bacterium]|nr:hypothetical protein [Gemmataceae bacterium]
MGSLDAYSELQASLLLVRTGHPGTDHPPPPEDYWVKAPNGRFYQAHDIGNVVLLVPAALLGSLSSSDPTERLVAAPPPISRVASALTYAVLGAFTALFAYKLFALFTPARTALLLTVLFVAATPFWAYTRTCWDVLGGCFGVAALVYFSARYLSAGADCLRMALFAGVAAGIACAFRFSLTPFLMLALAGVFLHGPSGLRLKALLIAGFSFAVALAPSLLYNAIRTGAPWNPATRAPQYAIQNSLDGDLLTGLYGLTVAPNHGLFLFSPILLLCFGVFFLRVARPVRLISLWFGVVTLLYTLTIAMKAQWAAMGWGPRYLVPFLPVFALSAGMTALHLWPRFRRSVLALTAASLVINIAPGLVNWPLALAMAPRAHEALAPGPFQQLAAWHAVWTGVNGRPLPAPQDLASDSVRSTGRSFPDFLVVRLMERSPAGLAAGLLALAVLLALGAWSLRLLIRIPAAQQ